MRLLRPLQLLALTASALALVATGATACGKGSHDDAADAGEPEGSTLTALTIGAADGGDAGPRVRGVKTQLAAANFMVSVVDAPAWPESATGAHRLGYLRHGAVVEVWDNPLVNDECTDGWFELVQGGFVCGKAGTLDLASPRVKLAPKQPDRDAGMPYRYGVNLTDGTPLYRRVLNSDDRKKYEPWLAPAKTTEETTEEKSEKLETADKTNPPEKSDREGREGEEESPQARRAPVDAGARDAGKPKLKSLKGRGVLVRKMARGFYLALDREFKAAGTRWWRTTYGFAVPHDRIMIHSTVTKHVGSWFSGALVDEAALAGAAISPFLADGGAPEDLTFAVGFVTHGYGHKYVVTDDPKSDGGESREKKVGWGEELSRRSSVMLTGKKATISGVTYHETSAGFWVRPAELKLAHPQIPADIAPNEKWIDVDLTRQMLVAFEGRRPVFATLISSGRRNLQDKEHDFPTPTGTFRIREKHVSTTMDGDVAADGPYSIEDVPWVMYFQGSYAFHGAFWHDQFGNVRSHGCVNLAPEDARTLFGWADPPLPEGWHGAFSADEASGTRVVIHEDKPPRR